MNPPRPTTDRSELAPAAAALRDVAIQLLEDVAHTNEAYTDDGATTIDRMQTVVHELGAVETSLSQE